MIKTQHPFIRDDGSEDAGLIKTYTDDETKVLKQVETDVIYGDACIDVYPCRYHYEEVDKPEEDVPEDLPQDNE